MEAITSPLKRQAVTCGATELCGFANRGVREDLPGLSATSLVTAIPAVFFVITKVGFGYTLIPSTAPEGVWSTLGTILLIRIVWTLPSPIA